jgi:hypothetical protein
MKLGIEELYTKIADWFSVLEGYLDDKLVGAVFRMCRLKPYELPSKANRSKFREHWIDEFGNSVYVKDKKLRMVLNDLSIDKQSITDLYGGLAFGKLARISKMAYVSKELVIFLGIDGYIRAFILTDRWHKCSPLLLGFDKLKVIAENSDIAYAIEKDGYWLTVMPMPKSMIERFGLGEVIDG